MLHHHRPAPADGVARWTGRIVQAYAVWLVVATLLVPLHLPVVRTIARLLSVTNVPTFPSVFSAVLVAVVASGLVRGQRAALWFVVWVWQAPKILELAVVLVLLGLQRFRPSLFESVEDTWSVPTWHFVPGVVGIGIVVMLVASRNAFPARLTPGAWWQALVVLVGGVATSALLTFLTLTTVVWHGHGVGSAVVWSLRVATGRSPGPHLHGPAWLALASGALSAAFLVLAIIVFMRAAPHDAARVADDELAVRRMLARDRRGDSLGYFATRDDRAVVLSADGRAAVSYNVVAGVALAAGDPLGTKDAWPDAIRLWQAHARTYGWVPAVLAASEAGAAAYARAGLRALVMGDEAVIGTRAFSLGDPDSGRLRRTVEHARRAGLHVLVRRQDDVPADELAQLTTAADAWRHGEVERGFSMALGRLGDARDGRAVVVTAHAPTGEVVGLLTFVPWGRRGLSLDVMRRSPDAAAGVTELMVTTLVERSSALGVDEVSLNFAMFRETFEHGARIGATLPQRVARRVLLVASRWWQLDSLYRANEKYRPAWSPRLLCYDNPAQLTQVLLAAGLAEGFVPGLPSCFCLPSRSCHRQGFVATPAHVDAVRALEAEVLEPRVVAPQLSEQQRVRHAKLEVLRGAGMEPYPAAVPRTVAVADVALLMGATTAGVRGPAEAAVGTLPDTLAVSVVGRVVRVRDHGGVIFADVREEGREVQVMLTADRPDARAQVWRQAVDLADVVSVTGDVVRTARGTVTVHARSWTMAAKSLVPPPRKHGAGGVSARSRHVEIALDERALHRVTARAAAVRALRETLAARGYLEVETPVLQRVHGGANARPFTTHINAYDLDLTLRIAPELFLKRLCVGGVPRVFEIARNFRNEGVDGTHNPEFTALEAYEAHGDYTTMRTLAQDLVVAAAVAVHGEPVVPLPDGGTLRVDGSWPVVTVHEAVSRATGTHVDAGTDVTVLAELCARHGIEHSRRATAGELVTELYEELVEGSTVAPTFYTDFPVETSPLTRQHRDDPRLAERWDLVAFGTELGTAYTELTDPVVQRERLTAQSLAAAAGDPEAMEVDDEFLDALGFGMVPTGGIGLGVDRLVMLVLGAPIRDVLTFPFTRPDPRLRRASVDA